MKCSKCGKEVDEKLLICPFCEGVIRKEKKGYHYNYATKSIELAAAKLTEEEIDPEYDLSKEKRNSMFPIFKDKLLVLLNALILIFIGLVLFLLSKFFFPVNPLWILLIVIIIGINNLSYEGIFYKAYKDPYYGLIPFARIYTLLSVSNEVDRTETTKKLMGIVMGYTIYYLMTLFSMYMFMFPLYHSIFYAMTAVSIVVYLKVRINVLGDLSLRFNIKGKGKALTIAFPYVLMAIYAFSKRYHYTKLNDSYL